MQHLTKEETIKENKKIARAGSWVNDLFEENKLSVKQKHEVLKSLAKNLKNKIMEA
jgi:hypothetical protein